MPLDFKADASTRVEFKPESGDEQFKHHEVKFPFKVRRAMSLLNGFQVEFSNNNERPLGQMEVNTRIARIEDNGRTVVVEVVFRLRDKDTNFNTKYGGFVDVGLVVERE
jgi:hypothetical protein